MILRMALGLQRPARVVAETRGARAGRAEQEGRGEVAEFLVYTCRECRCAYAGVLEATDRLNAFGDRTGLCSACLEQLVGWRPSDEGVESREESSGTASDA